MGATHSYHVFDHHMDEAKFFAGLAASRDAARGMFGPNGPKDLHNLAIEELALAAKEALRSVSA